MTQEQPAMLESDRLDDLLEAPVPAPPVLVVEYRDRVGPPKVFFLVLFVVPLVAIFLYHRTVVERYRVQVARANAALVRATTAQSSAGMTALVQTDTPGPSVALAKDSALPEVSTAATAAVPSSVPVAVSENGKAAAALIEAAPRVSLEAGGSTLIEQTPAPVAAAATVVAQEPPAAAVPAPPSDAITGELTAEQPKLPKITTRSILPNPFADGAEAPKPPAPATLQPGVEDMTTAVKPQGAVPAQAAAAAPASGSDIAANALAPLPSKEESLQQIQQEAAQREADLAAQVDKKDGNLQAQRIAEQVKFRDELREVIRMQGNRAGPEIDRLAQRYGYEVDEERMTQARHVWHYSRKSQAEKVKLIRTLGLSDTVILNFLSDDLYRNLSGRDGPRNESELRFLAAKQLLRYPAPKSRPAGRADNAAADENAPARPSSSSRIPVARTPR